MLLVWAAERVQKLKFDSLSHVASDLVTAWPIVFDNICVFI